MISRFPPPAFDPTKFNTEMKSLISKALSLAFVLVILTIRQPLLLCICSIAVERIHKSMDKTFRQSLLLLLIPAFLLAAYGLMFFLRFVIHNILEWFPLTNVCGVSLSCLVLCAYYYWQEMPGRIMKVASVRNGLTCRTDPTTDLSRPRSWTPERPRWCLIPYERLF